MKGSLAWLLAAVMIAVLLVGCGADEPEETEPLDEGSQEESQTETGEESQTELREDPAESENDAADLPTTDMESDSLIPDNYEVLSLTRNDVTVRVGFDPDKIDGTSYTSWANLMGTEKPVSLLSVYVKNYASVEDYANDALSVYTEADPNAAYGEIVTVAFGSINAKHFTITYQVKSYITDEKLENMTEDEIAQLEYTLEEKTDDRYVVEIGEGVLLQLSFTNDNAQKLMDYIAVELAE